MSEFRSRSPTRCAIAIVLATAGVPGTHAGESSVLLAPTPLEDAGFGYALASAGEWLAVGAPGENDAEGAVYLFRCVEGACAPPQRLSAPDPDDEAEFGAAISIQGSRLAIGSPGDGHGVVDVFELQGFDWTHDVRLAAFDGNGGDRFGHALALDGDRLLVGAPRANLDAGAAYAFERNTSQWNQAVRVLPSASAPGDRFGHALAVAGGRAWIAAPLRDTDASASGFAQGTVFAFVHSGDWIEVQALSRAGAASGTRFGWSLSLSATAGAVGAPGSDAARGAIHRYTSSGPGWVESDSLILADAQPGDRLGWHVGPHGDDLIAGLPLAGQGAGFGCGRMVRFVDTNPGVRIDLMRVRAPSQAALAGWTSVQHEGESLVSAPALSGAAVAGAGAVLRFDPTLSLQHDGYESGPPGCGPPGE
jgi:hypothetical protein